LALHPLYSGPSATERQAQAWQRHRPRQGRRQVGVLLDSQSLRYDNCFWPVDDRLDTSAPCPSQRRWLRDSEVAGQSRPSIDGQTLLAVID